MVENLSCAVHAFHYLRRNRIAYQTGSSSKVTGDDYEHAFPLPTPCRRRLCLVAQLGDLAFGPLPQHARTAGARHRFPRVRACSGGREQRRQGAVPDPLVASAPSLVPPSRHPTRKREERLVVVHLAIRAWRSLSQVCQGTSDDRRT